MLDKIEIDLKGAPPEGIGEVVRPRLVT